MSIKSKLIISYLSLIIFSVSILGFLIGNKSQKAVFDEVTEKSEHTTQLINSMVSVRNDLLSEKVWSDLHLAEKLLNGSGQLRIDNTQQIQVGNYKLPSLYAGNTNLTLDTTLVDDIKESIGAIASVFLLKDEKLIRVTTNVTKNGKRAMGTYISNNSPIYKKIINNKHYRGRALVIDNWFITGYRPLLDENGKVIGALALGYTQLNNFLEKTLSDIKIGETGYIYIMNSKGDLLLHPNIKGQSIKNFDFSKEIIKNKNGKIEYKFNGVYKLAAYRYFEPYDWYIVTTANYDDLKSSSKTILYTILLAGFIILLISTLIALLSANTLVKPINKLKNYMEIAGTGDLTVQSDINSKDEIGILSNSFNNMMKENKRLLEETRKCDQLKTEFFANISHELKTPLNIIFSTAQLFDFYINNEKINTTKLNKYTGILKQNCYRLLRLVNNLIDVTKIDSGFMELDLKNQNIIEVVENITLSTAEYIKNKSRTIIFDTDTEEKIIAVDPEKMERIILNLISNATKFTKPGDEIKVTINDNNDYVHITIKDTGLGIPENELEKIFERFKQVDPLLSRNHEGSGIGLSLVKSLVEMHKGTITVKSEYGKGTEFIIELPVKLIPEENNTETLKHFTPKTNVEKIQIEFSDIYS
ncbi:Cache 3/Cache 2 fusion domain-containing protein [Clostridium ganghwense]|uniref:histidine kinase n=1 Tax=Clostridium ganghwense TaxID=312089 RepID=A0ABT4CTK7_9CLOT|nr:Cache 3/Cache 2 fusion domain-containing protein [Clostridium ganghwense]MCY6371294.1 Cache 3/Cache 2 fusion domain-containing protein [Clostridium ganghwense]